MKETLDKKNLSIPDDILDKWQNIVDIMAEIIDVPAALIMKVKGPYIEVLRSSQTEDNPCQVGDREHLAGLYCEKVTNEKDKLLVPNALKDEKWKDNPDVELGMISYLGYPLLWPDGEPFGTICVLDSEENTYSRKADRLIKQFKGVIEGHLGLLYQRQELKKEIKKRKKVEESLKKSEKKFRTYIENSPYGVFVADAKGNYLEVNEAACKITGYSKDELLDMNILDNYDPENHLEVIGKYQALQEKNEIRLELPYRRKDGSERYWDINSIKLAEDRYLGFVEDITNRKKVEEDLRKSEKKYRILAEHSADVIYKMNIENEEYTYVSPSVEIVFGYTPQEALSLGPKDILTPKSYQKQLEAMQEELAKGGESTGTLQLEVVHKDGHTFPVEVHASLDFSELLQKINLHSLGGVLSSKK